MPALTLRTRAALLATLIAGVTLAIASVALVLTLEARLTAGVDSLSRSRVVDLLDVVAAGGLPERLTNLDDEGVAQVVGTDGRVVAASANVAGQPRISELDPDEGLVVTIIDAPDDDETERYRVWAGTGPGPDGPVTVYVGHSLESVQEASSTLRQSLLLGGPLVLLLLAGGIWWVIGAALRRVERIRVEVEEITEDRLDRRVPESEVRDEVGRLAATMNGMLTRLEAAQHRQRAFVADVSHDLQSPLASQRAQLEVFRAHPETADSELLTRDLLATTSEMEHLVRDLLFLAAADEGGEIGGAAAVPVSLDVEDVVLEEAARARTGTDVAIDTARVSAAPGYASRAEVQRIVRNLLDNAVAHAGSSVTLVLAGEGGTARLDVLDDGAGVTGEDRDRIFDRFYRGDAARSRHRAGSGLGLAIARTLAERNGGRLDVEPDAPGGHFVLRLPSTLP